MKKEWLLVLVAAGVVASSQVYAQRGVDTSIRTSYARSDQARVTKATSQDNSMTDDGSDQSDNTSGSGQTQQGGSASGSGQGQSGQGQQGQGQTQQGQPQGGNTGAQQGQQTAPGQPATQQAPQRRAQWGR